MAKYLLAVHSTEGDAPPSDDHMQLAFKQVDEFNTKVMDAGAWVFAGGLQPADAAKVVRGQGDGAVLTDGPYLESKEHLGGFWVIDATDLDVALGWAKDAAAACMQPVEVQPFADFSDVAPTAEGRPQFLLSVHMGEGGPPREMTPEQMQESWQKMQELEAQMQASQTWLYSARLGGPDTATVVTTKGSDVVLTDGPFAESKEHLAGFYVIAADDVDGALDWGRQVTACVGAPIEVRPFQVEPS